MVKLGYFLSCEEFDAPELVRQARLAEDQAAATSAVLTGGRFTLGVGSGEALNEHVLGDPWPSADLRLAMVTPVGPDLKTHVEALRKFVDAGYDELYVQQIGPEQDAFFDFFAAKVAPELR